MSAIPLSQLGAAPLDASTVTTSNQEAILLSGQNSNPGGTRIYRSHVTISGVAEEGVLLPAAPDGFKSQILMLWISCSVASSVVGIGDDGLWDTGGVGDPYGTHTLAEGESVFLGSLLGGALFETPQDPDPLPIIVNKTTGATLTFTVYWRNVAL